MKPTTTRPPWESTLIDVWHCQLRAGIAPTMSGTIAMTRMICTDEFSNAHGARFLRAYRAVLQGAKVCDAMQEGDARMMARNRAMLAHMRLHTNFAHPANDEAVAGDMRAITDGRERRLGGRK